MKDNVVSSLICDTNRFLASDADPLNVATDELITWSVVVKDPLSVAIGAVDDPLILVTNSSLASDADPLKPVVIEPANRFLASDADPLKDATDELIIWSVVVSEALKLEIGSVDDPLILATNTFLEVEDDPLSVDIDALIAWSVAVKEALKGDIDSLKAKNEPLKRAIEALCKVSTPAPPAPVITHPCEPAAYVNLNAACAASKVIS